jgi:hypothetical protein
MGFTPFVNYNNILVFVIVPIYQIVNIIKIVIIFIFQAKNKILKINIFKFWLILSIISFIITVLFITIVFWAFSRGA